MEKESFVFYRSFYEALKELPEQQKVKVLEAICELALNDIEIELTGIELALFKLIKPQLEANNKRYKNGCKGGAPKGNENAKKSDVKTTKKQPKNNQKQPNDNDNVNDNDNDNDIKKELIEKKAKPFFKPSLEEVTNYCMERNNHINPESWIDFYESKNWMIGKNKMKDWKAAIRTWESRDKQNGKKKETEPVWISAEIKEQVDLEKEQELKRLLGI